MKLKKIASLALAGIMAVSMLAGCNGSSSGDGDTTVTPPVDNSFATSVNAELSDEQKEVITFESDSALASALNNMAGKLSTNDLSATITGMTSNASVLADFRKIMNADANLGLANGFRGTTTSEDVYADLIIVPGRYTEAGAVEEVANYLSNFINSNYMPSAIATTPATHKYEYTGDIAITNVENSTGNVSAYVVGVVITKTAVKSANA